MTLGPQLNREATTRCGATRQKRQVARCESSLNSKFEKVRFLDKFLATNGSGPLPTERQLAMGCGTAALCEQCASLLDYAFRKLDRCVFGADKPVCAKCPIHCYKPEMRERIQRVMRYAGPRMLLSHPVLAVGHLLDKRKPAPPGRQDNDQASDCED